MWCTDLHAGETLTHIKLSFKIKLIPCSPTLKLLSMQNKVHGKQMNTQPGLTRTYPESSESQNEE